MSLTTYALMSSDERAYIPIQKNKTGDFRKGEIPPATV